LVLTWRYLSWRFDASIEPVFDWLL